MKKQRVALIVILCMIASMSTACISVERVSPITTNKPTTPKEADASEPAEANDDSADTNNNQTDKKTVFEQFEEALKADNVTYNSRIMGADLVGAIEGMKYEIDGGKVELYLFDKTSDAYATAEQSQALTMEGFEPFGAIVENGMAIMIEGLDEDYYLKIFRSINNEES